MTHRRRPPRSALLALLVVPIVAAGLLLARSDGRLTDAPDSGIYRGLAANVAEHRSFTTPGDQVWLRLSPAEVVARRGFVPVADFAPLYPVVLAAPPAGDGTAVALHALALAGAIAAVGLLVARATGRAGAGLVAQIFVLFGPVRAAPFALQATTADLYLQALPDGLAATLLVGAVAVAGWPDRSDASGRRVWAAAGGLAVACLLRYALLGAVAGLALAAWADGRRHPSGSPARAASRRAGWVTAAAGVPALAWSIGYRFATHGPGAKSFTVAAVDESSVGLAVAGWVGVDPGPSAFWGYTALAVVLALTLAAVTHRSRVVRVAGAALAGYLALHLATPILLDRSFTSASDRTLLSVRLLLVVIVAGLVGAPRGDRDRAARPARAPVRTAPAPAPVLGLGLVAVLIVVGAGPRLFHLPTGAGPVRLTAAAPTVPVLTNAPDWVFLHLASPVVDLPRDREPTTGARRDLRAEAADLVTALRPLTAAVDVIMVDDLAPAPVAGPRDWPRCAAVGPEVDHGTYRVYRLDLAACPS